MERICSGPTALSNRCGSESPPHMDLQSTQMFDMLSSKEQPERADISPQVTNYFGHVDKSRNSRYIMGNEPMGTPSCFLTSALTLWRSSRTSRHLNGAMHCITSKESDEDTLKVMWWYLGIVHLSRCIHQLSERFVSLTLTFRPVSPPPTPCSLHFSHVPQMQIHRGAILSHGLG